MWELAAIPPIAVMVVSDFRSRTVGVWTIGVTCVLTAAAAVAEYGFRAAVMNMLCNIPVCILTGTFVMAYLKVRKLHPAHAIGGGDIIFILALTPLFTVKGFLVFMTVSSILTLAVWGMYTIIRLSRGKTDMVSIPFISGLGICLTVHLVASSLGLYRHLTSCTIFWQF